MNLKDFVAESLKQIIDGVLEAQKYSDENGGCIAPVVVVKEPRGGGYTLKSSVVEFDIAVTAQKSAEREGKAVIVIPYFGMGGKLASGEQSATVSRVKFEIPVVLPTQNRQPE